MKRFDAMHSVHNLRKPDHTRRQSRKILAPFLFAVLMAALCTANTAHAVQYSKLGIVTAAKQAGKWEQVKAWISAANLTDEWQAASYFSDDYPLFTQITNQVVASGLATHAEVQAFLAAARDASPDALISDVYAREVATDSGRRRWHGERVAQIVTNIAERIVRIDIYADGFAWTNAAQRIRPYDPEEARRRREEAARKAEEARRAWERANLPADVADARAAQREAAKTNEVTVIIEGN